VLRRIGIVASYVVLGVAVVLAVTGRDSASYRRDHVVAAFAQQGFPLVDAPPIAGLVRQFKTAEALLVPTTGEPFWVYVGPSDADAKASFEPHARLALPPETFDLLRGNVMVISDSGVSVQDRQRIRAVVRSLEPPR
jgi:hypothetical protein